MFQAICSEKYPHGQVHLVRGRGKREALRHHTHDLEGLTVEREGPSQNIGIAAQAALPKRMADRRDRWRTRFGLLRGDRATHRGGNSEHFEEIP